MCLEVNGLGKISERLRRAQRYRSLRYLLDPQPQHNAHNDFDGKVERSDRTDRCMNLCTHNSRVGWQIHWIPLNSRAVAPLR